MTVNGYKFRVWNGHRYAEQMEDLFIDENGVLFEYGMSKCDCGITLDRLEGCIVEMCTGICDMYGSVLYDNDICNRMCYGNPDGTNIIVHRFSGCWNLDKSQHFNGSHNESSYTVEYQYKLIGNVHENKDIAEEIIRYQSQWDEDYYKDITGWIPEPDYQI